MKGVVDRLRSVLDNEARLRRILDTWALIRTLAEELGPALDLDVVLKLALDGLRKIVDFRGGTIQLIDERGIYVAAAHPPVSDDVLASRLPLGEGLSGQVIASGQAVYSPDLDADPRVDPRRRSFGTNAAMRSYLGVPLICLGETIGVMQVDSPEPDAFDTDDATVMAGLATLVAGAIESSRRFREVMELERLKSDFIGRVSHELRTPITIVDGFLSTMLTYGDAIDGDRQRNMLERSQAAVGRLAGLIEDLITLSRLETGVLAVAPESRSGSPSSSTPCAPAASTPRRCTIRCAPRPRVTADAELLARAIGFVVDNAVKYGGRADVVVADDGRTVVGYATPGRASPTTCARPSSSSSPAAARRPTSRASASACPWPARCSTCSAPTSRSGRPRPGGPKSS